MTVTALLLLVGGVTVDVFSRSVPAPWAWIGEDAASNGGSLLYTSLALNSSGNPGIAYRNSAGHLAFTLWNGTAWNGEEVSEDGGVTSYGYRPRLRFDTADRPHIVHIDDTNDRVRYTWKLGAVWVRETVATTVAGLGGVPIDFQLDSNDCAHVVYSDPSNVHYYRNKTASSCTAWGTPEEIDPTAAAGGHHALALDAADLPRIVYRIGSALWYVFHDGVMWRLPETVDTSGGYFPRLLLNATGEPRTVYYEPTADYVLKYAERYNGTWTMTTVDGDLGGTIIWHPGMALNATEARHVLYSHADDSTYHAWSDDGTIWTNNTLTGEGLNSLDLAYDAASDILYGSGGQDVGNDIRFLRAIPDNAAPTSNVESFSPYWTIPGDFLDPFMVIVNASDDVGLYSVALYYRWSPDNSSWSGWTPYDTDYAAPWEFSFAFNNSEGFYEFYSIATDFVGQQDAVPAGADAIVAMEETAPTGSVDPFDPYWHGTPFNVSVTANDPPGTLGTASGIRNVTLCFDYTNWNGSWINLYAEFATDESAPFEFAFPFAEGTGWYQFRVITRDWAGNSDFSGPSEGCESLVPGAGERMGYDITPPTTTPDAISPYWYATSPLAVSGISEDTDPLMGWPASAGMANVTLYHNYSADNASWSNGTFFGVDDTEPYSFDFTWPDGSGWYRFLLLGTDNLGNMEAPNLGGAPIAGYDLVEPGSALDPAPGFWFNANADLTATASDFHSGVDQVNLSYRHSADNATFGNDAFFTADPTAPYSFALTWPDGEGYYALYTTAVDIMGNEEAGNATEITIAYDATDPVSSVDAPASYWNAAPTTLDVNASDGLSGVAEVLLQYRYSLDGAVFGGWNNFSTDAAAPFSFLFDFPDGDGYYEFQSLATDNASNVEAPPATPDTAAAYDIVGPTSSAVAVAPYWRNAAVNVTATANDVHAGVAEVDLYYWSSIDNASFGNLTLFGSDTSAPFEWMFTFPEGPGYYRLATQAEDANGNWEAGPVAADAALGYDDTSPTSSVDPLPMYWFTADATANVTANDDLSGVANVTLYYDFSADNTTWIGAAIFGSDVTAPYAFPFTFPAGPGDYRLWSVATDNAGNVEAPPPFDAELGFLDLPPTAVAQALPDTAVRGQAIEFNASASSDDFGIVSYEWDFGDGTNGTGVVASHAYSALGMFNVTLTVTDGANQSDSDTIAVTIVNQAPVADAGADAAGPKKTTILLNGSASSDPDGDALTFSWVQTDGPAVTPANASAAVTSFVPPVAGVYNFTLTVDDGNGGSDTATVSFTATNAAPTADAGADFAAPKNAAILLDGSASSDADGDALTYNWTQTSGPAVAVTDANTAVATFTPSQVGTYVFTLSVDDGDGGSASDTVSITVWSRAPTAELTASAARVNVGVNVTLDASASSDPDGTILDYAFDFDDGSDVNGTDATAVHAFSTPGIYDVTVTVTDSDGNASSETVSVVVNAPPTAAIQVTPATVNIGTTVSFSGSGSTDTDGVVVNWTWDFGDGSAGYGETLTHAYASRQAFPVTLTVRDADGATGATSTTVTVANRPPTANAGPNATATAGTSVALVGTGSDPDSDALTYSWTQIGGPEVTIEGANEASASFRPQLEGTYIFELTVSDGAGGTVQARVTITVSPAPLFAGGGLLLLLLPIALLIGIVLLLLLLRKKKAKAAEEPEAEEETKEAKEEKEEEEESEAKPKAETGEEAETEEKEEAATQESEETGGTERSEEKG